MGSRNQKVSVNGGGHCQFIGLTHVWDKFGFDPSQLNPDYIYYGESMNRHVVHYNDEVPPFIGFDILDRTTGRFIMPEAMIKEFTRLYLSYAESVRIDRDFEFNQVSEIKSVYGPTVEGIVIKNYDRLNQFGRPLFAKIVNEQFKEVKKIPKPTVDNAGERAIVQQYCTAARLKKVISIIEDSGVAWVVDMSAMPRVFNLMIDDILAEHILDIRRDVKSINFAALAKLVGAKTARLLQNYFKDNAISAGK